MNAVTKARHRVRLVAALGMVVLAILGFAAFKFTGTVTGHATLTAQRSAGQRKGATRHSASPATAPPPPSHSASATSHASTPPQPQTITPVSAVAFGPNGTADGDNPQLAGRVLTDPALGWETQWYATPEFGDLKQGTGLLLDMGRTVSISSVRLTLGSLPGAQVQLRLGTSPDFGVLSEVTAGTATGPTLSLTPSAPAKARYVLLWFTRLPPDGAGTYQVLVHQVTVRGQP